MHVMGMIGQIVRSYRGWLAPRVKVDHRVKHLAITHQTFQKFEKSQMTPDVPELLLGVMTRDGAAGFFAAIDMAVPFCGGINL